MSFTTHAVLKIGEYTNNSRHLARKYARIFVRGHYLFREANSFLRAKFEENCELRGTDNVQGQISEHIFAPNGGYCVCLQIFFATRVAVKIGEYLVNKPLQAAGMSADNVRGWEIVRKINIWPRSKASRANLRFWGQSLSQGHYQQTYQQARKEFIYFISLPLIFNSQNFKTARKHGKKPVVIWWRMRVIDVWE